MGGEGTYEPSADELIDVLKNLENLAAINPALYRAIVDQIKGPVQDSHTNGYKELVEHEQEYEQGYSEVDQNVVYEEHYHETGEINGGHTETDHVAVMEHEQHQHSQSNVQQKSMEEMKQEEKEARIQAEVQREHEEQMRMLKEKKRKEKEPPPPPKTITVMAGARNM